MRLFQYKNMYRMVVKLMFLAIVLLIASVFIQSLVYQEARISSEISENWTDEYGNTMSLTEFSDLEGGQSAFFRLDNVPANQVLVFRSRNLHISLKINGKDIYSDRNDTPKIFGSSPGSRWYQFALPMSDSEIMVEIHGVACFPNSKGHIDSVYVGTTVDVTNTIMKDKFFGFLVDSVWAVSGIFLLLFYLFLHSSYKINKDFFYLSSGFFFCAVWSSTENTMWQYFIGHSEMIHIIGYISIMAITLSFGLLLIERLEGKWRKLSYIYSVMVMIDIIIINLLQFTGIAEYHYSMDSLYVLFFLLLPFAYKLFQSYTREIALKKYKAIMEIAFVLMGILVVIGICKYLIGQYANYADYIQYALLIFLLMLMIYHLVGLNLVMKKGLESELMHELSLLDHLTKFYNRTAFAEHTAEYELKLKEHSPLGIIQFDVNNLKVVNDNQGHEKGDELLCLASSGIFQSFGSYGKCYRMGGDEFLIMLTGENPKLDYEAGVENLTTYCSYANSVEDRTFDINIAHGFALVSDEETIVEAMARADGLMYENKRRMKKGLDIIV